MISALQAAGYKVEALGLTCEPEEALRRNLHRGDNISAYFAGPFQTRWIVAACGKASGGGQAG